MNLISFQSRHRWNVGFAAVSLFAVLAFFSLSVSCEMAWTLVSVLSVIVMFLLARHHKFFLYLCVFFSTIMTVNFIYDSPTTTINNLYNAVLVPILLFACVLMARCFLLRERAMQSDVSIYILPLLMLGFHWGSLLWSLDRNNGTCLSINMTVSVVLFIMMTSVVYEKSTYRRLLLFISVMSIVLFSLCMLSRYQAMSYSYEFNSKWRFSSQLYSLVETQGKPPRPGGFATPQAASNVLAFCIFCILALTYGVKSRSKKAMMFFWCCVLFLGMLFTATKAAILGCIAGLFVSLYLSRRIHRKPLILCGLVLVAAFCVLMIQVLLLGVDRLAGGGESATVAAASLSTRLEFWSWGFNLLNNWWFGAGAGGYLAVSDPVPYAHSLYFCMLFDLGLLGLLLLWCFFFEAVLRLRKGLWICRDAEVKWWICCICGAFTCLLIHSLVDLDYTMSYFWMVMGMIYIVAGIVKNNYRNEWNSFPVSVRFKQERSCGGVDV